MQLGFHNISCHSMNLSEIDASNKYSMYFCDTDSMRAKACSDKCRVSYALFYANPQSGKIAAP